MLFVCAPSSLPTQVATYSCCIITQSFTEVHCLPWYIPPYLGTYLLEYRVSTYL